jgi:uncharacterized membrane protein
MFMNKQMFLDGLRAALAELPIAERDKTLAYYEEMINDRIEDGMSETEAVASLEPVEVLAARIINETPMMQKAVRKAKKSGISTPLLIVLIIIGFPVWLPLLATLFGIIIAVFATMFALIITLVCLVLGLLIGGLATLISAPFTGGLLGGSIILAAGAGLIAAGIAILLIYPVWYLIKLIWAGLKKLCRKIRSWFTRKEA